MWLLSQLLLVALVLGILAAFTHNARERNRRRLPPGPKFLPLVGNAHQLSIHYQERAFAEWGRTYGDLIYARLFRLPVLIINSIQIARELLDKRSAKYSGRPQLVMLDEMLGWSHTVATMDYGDQWKKQRRWAQSTLHDQDYMSVSEQVRRRETCVLLESLVATPDAFLSHLKRYSAATIMEVLYGHTVTSEDDQFVATINKAMEGTVECTVSGAVLIDFLPILKHIPAWFPGTYYRRRAPEVKRLVQDAVNRPFEMVKRCMELGTAKPSIVASLLEASIREGTLGEDEKDIKGLSQTLYGAGAETTSAVLITSVLAMTLHPEVLRKAQAEVDQVVGNGRLPDWSDRENMPYIECVLKEVYRWICPLPFGVPHCVTEDDEYSGYYIPKGAMALPNIWSMTQNPELYPEPDKFIPERFLKMDAKTSNLADPSEYVYGFGRRICPGRQFADMNVWLAIACIIATLNIQKATDSAGNEITPDATYEPGIVSHPRPFKCSISPRSERFELMIAEAKVTQT